MKYLLLIVLFTIIGCTSKGETVTEKAFPFSLADRVEVIAFQESELNDENYKIVDGNLIFDKIKIINKVILDNSHQNDLYTILHTDNCPEHYTVADCYRPVHRIIFYKKSKVIAFLEVCLQCTGNRKSEGFDTEDLCDAKMKELESFFRSVGITHFTDF